MLAPFDAIMLMSKNPEAEGRSIYEDPAFWERLGTPARAPPPGWDPAVLQDMRDPLFTEHKRRFEVWKDAQVDDW